MRTEQLEYLIEISKNTSMNAASDKLFITPAALTLSIKKLEEELHTELLTRSNRGVELTKDGIRIVEAAKVFLQEVDAVKNKTDAEEELAGVIDIYTGQNAVDQFWPQLICEFHEKYPNVYINPIVRDIQSSLESMLCDESKELLFCYDLWNVHNKYSIDENRFEFCPLSFGKQYCVVSRKLNIAKYKIISKKTLEKYPFLVYGANSYSSEELQSMRLDYANNAEKIVILNNQAVYNEMLYNGLGYSINVLLPLKNNFTQREDLAYIPVEEYQDRFCKFGYIACRQRPLSKLAQTFIAYVKEFFLEYCL